MVRKVSKYVNEIQCRDVTEVTQVKVGVYKFCLLESESQTLVGTNFTRS